MQSINYLIDLGSKRYDLLKIRHNKGLYDLSDMSIMKFDLCMMKAAFNFIFILKMTVYTDNVIKIG